MNNEIDKLRNIIHHHNKKYYVDAQPEISDFEYDTLIKKLIDLEQQHPEAYDPNSPSQRIYGDISKGFNTVEHTIAMKSLGNTYSEKELIDFNNRIVKNINTNPQYVVELKIDGVSISIRYKNGKYSQAITRGDGQYGDDVSNNIRTIKSIPLILNKPDNLEVRGEVFLAKSIFKTLNKERMNNNLKPFANPRNTSAGSIKLLDPKEVSKRQLDAFFYGIANADNKNIPQTHFDRLNYIKTLGLKVNGHIALLDSIHDVIEYINTWIDKRHDLDYDTDGMVIKVNSISQQNILGYTAKEPRWAISYKFPAKQMSSIIEDISLSVGRLGIITPIAILNPILLSGTKVSRASLHNFDEITRKDIRIGDTVFIEKGGEIIPQVISVVESKRKTTSTTFPPPISCPCCKTNLVKEDVFLICPNINCSEQLKRRIQYFASKDAMDIDGLGENIIELFINKELIKDYGDLFYLTKDMIINMEGFKDKSVDNLISSINNSKSRPLYRLIKALGIKHIGSRASTILANNFNSIAELKQANTNSLTNIDDIGPTMANSIIDFFKQAYNLNIILKLEKAGVSMKESMTAINKDNFFFNKTFVLTGSLTKLSRKEAQDKIISYGGNISSSISKKTHCLIAGTNPGSKLDKANKLNITILSEQEFIEQLK